MTSSTEPRILMYTPKSMKKDTCRLIMHKFKQKEKTEVEYLEEQAVQVVNDDEKDSFKYIDKLGRLCWNITPTSEDDYMYFADKIMPTIPEHPDFEFISYLQVMEYPTGSSMPFHNDNADTFDTATAVIFLDDDYTGGNLIVDDITFNANQGDAVLFNHSTSVWHGVSTVKTGIRTVLAVWFQNELSHDPLPGEVIQAANDDMLEETESLTYNALL